MPKNVRFNIKIGNSEVIVRVVEENELHMGCCVGEACSIGGNK